MGVEQSRDQASLANLWDGRYPLLPGGHVQDTSLAGSPVCALEVWLAEDGEKFRLCPRKSRAKETQ